MINEWLFIISYHRPDNCKTIATAKRYGWNEKKIVVVCDDAAGDNEQYAKMCEREGVSLKIVSYEESVRRYDYVHRPSKGRRSAGQFRNLITSKVAREFGAKRYIIMDDDTTGFVESLRRKKCSKLLLENSIAILFDIMERRRIGCCALSQTGDYIGGGVKRQLLGYKLMNFTLYLTDYVQAGERGVQDNDTSLSLGMLRRGYFHFTAFTGAVLSQMQSAKQSGGLTDNYNENKLANKAVITAVQEPSCCRGERQKVNGGRLHHRITYRFCRPKLMKIVDLKRFRDTISWDRYPSDMPFTQEPNRDWRKRAN